MHRSAQQSGDWPACRAACMHHATLTSVRSVVQGRPAAVVAQAPGAALGLQQLHGSNLGSLCCRVPGLVAVLVSLGAAAARLQQAVYDSH